jgi:anti-sigma regulatory factor (Ser/Thr protein kinase)
MELSGFRHEAAIYRDSDDFLAATVPFLRVALEAGEPTLVAVREKNTTLLEGELGKDADAICFADMETLGRNPARIIPFWREFVDEHAGEAVRGVGEPVWPGRRQDEIDECQRHESLLDVAFSAPPTWSLLCPYDARGLDDEVLEAVAHSHQAVERDGVRRECAAPAGEESCFAGDLPERPAGCEPFEFDRTGLFDVRQRVAWLAKSAELPLQDTTDLVVAASELAANSIVHGGGTGTLHAWREDGRLLVEVEDRGSIEEPLVGRVRPLPTQVGGRGLWLANQFCDLVQIRSGSTGTAVRLQMSAS